MSGPCGPRPGFFVCIEVSLTGGVSSKVCADYESWWRTAKNRVELRQISHARVFWLAIGRTMEEIQPCESVGSPP